MVNGVYSDHESEIKLISNKMITRNVRKGKLGCPQSIYINTCKCLLEWGTLEGIVAALFIVMTQNLVCCGNNTGKVRLSHMFWNLFDTMGVNFWHAKIQ